MKVFSNGNIGMLNTRPDNAYPDESEGIFEEVDRRHVPKELVSQEKNAGGAGLRFVSHPEYFFSNTAGKSLGKWYRKIADRVRFTLKNIEDLRKIKNTNDFLEGLRITQECLERNNINFWVNHSCVWDEDRIIYALSVKLEKKDWVSLPHPLEEDSEFVEYEDFFVGKDDVRFAFKWDVYGELKEEEDHAPPKSLENIKNLTIRARKDGWDYDKLNKLIQEGENQRWLLSDPVRSQFFTGNK